MAPEITNAVTHLYDGLDGRDWVDHHWDAFVAIHAEDVVVEARTHAGERYRVDGRDAAMAEARSLADVGLTHVTMEPLAVHGERLALIRWLNWSDETDHGGGTAAVDQVCVVAINDDRKVQHVVIFDAEDRALAEEEYAARAARG